MITRLIPASLRRTIKPYYLACRQFLQIKLIEPLELAVGLRSPLVPPRSLMYVGGGDFKAIGEEFRRYFIELCELQPNHSMLEIGCGVGRIALPLTTYLDPHLGRYEGFDPVPGAIKWCQRFITPRFPNFHFQQVDVRNGFYHPAGHQQASQLLFSYPDQHFDLVVLVGVFTHMSLTEIDHYLAEIRRVLRPEGRVFTSFFLLDDVSRKLMTRPESAFNFQYTVDGRYTFDPINPSKGTAHLTTDIEALFEKNQFELVMPIQHGDWSRRQPCLSFLDIAILQKSGAK